MGEDDDVQRTVEFGAGSDKYVHSEDSPPVPRYGGGEHRSSTRLICVGSKHLEHLY